MFSEWILELFAKACLMPKPIDYDARDLEELLDQLEWSADTDHQQISVQEILTAVGTRSFGPLLLLVGALIASPLSGIPVFPSVVAMIVLLVSLQMLMGRTHFWLPAWLLHRTVARDKMATAVRWLRPPARFIDYFIRPRLLMFVKGAVAKSTTALLCLVVSSVMPLLELIPFSASLAGVVLTAFGLSLVARDGLLAIVAYMTAGATLWLAIQGLIM